MLPRLLQREILRELPSLECSSRSPTFFRLAFGKARRRRCTESRGAFGKARRRRCTESRGAFGKARRRRCTESRGAFGFEGEAFCARLFDEGEQQTQRD